MPGKLQNKVCLITGSTGIAASTAELASSEGALIFLASNTSESCQALTQKLRAANGPCDFHVADLSRAASANVVVQNCLTRFGRIDALVNIAGISGRKYGDGPAHECTDEGWDITLETNLKSMFLLCRAVLRHMLNQPAAEDGLRGSILNMSSVLAFSPEPRHFASHAYAASKAAIIGLSKAMAAYYAPHGIRVNILAAGLVRTPMSLRAQHDPEIVTFIKSKQPLCGDLIEPDDVAHAAVFLMSDESRRITGEVLTIDAGWCVSGSP